MLFVFPIRCNKCTCNLLAEDLNHLRFNNRIKFHLDLRIFEVTELFLFIGLFCVVRTILVFFVDVCLLTFGLLIVKVLDLIFVCTDTLKGSFVVRIVVMGGNDGLLTVILTSFS